MTSGSDPLIRLGSRDTVAVARFDIAEGQSLGDDTARQSGHSPRPQGGLGRHACAVRSP